MRKRREETGKAKALTGFYRQEKKKKISAEDSKPPNLGEERENEKQGKGFFACYLLISLSPRHKGHTYIGFTVNPRRRIRQHNGEIGSGAWRTKNGRPWEMVLCVYGFPTNVSALQFEWAWQHPKESVAVRHAAAAFRSLSGVANKIKLAYAMLTLPPWESLNLAINYFSTKYTKHSAGCPSLPEQMVVQVRSMDDLPCYTGEDEGFSTNKDDWDDLGECDEASNAFDARQETFTDTTMSTSEGSACRIKNAYQHFLIFEEYEARTSGDPSILGLDHSQPFEFMLMKTAPSTASRLSTKEIDKGGDMSITGKNKLTYAIEDDEDPRPLRERLLVKKNRDTKTITKKHPDAIEANEHPGPLRERPLTDSNEKLTGYRENRSSKPRVKQSTDAMEDDEDPAPLRERVLTASIIIEADQIHSFGPSHSQMETKSSSVSSLSALETIGHAVVNITEMESPTGTAFANEVAYKQQTTEAAVDNENCQSSMVARQAEIIDLSTPPSVCRYRQHNNKSRVPKSSSEIIYLA